MLKNPNQKSEKTGLNAAQQITKHPQSTSLQRKCNIAKINPDYSRLKACTPLHQTPKSKSAYETDMHTAGEQYAHCFLIQAYYTPFFTKIQAFCKKTDGFVDYDNIYVNIVMLTSKI